MKYINPYPIIFAFVLFISCKSFNKNGEENKLLITYKFIKYPTGNIKEEYKYEDQVLNSIKYLDENEVIDSLQLYYKGKLSSTIKYSYSEDGTINADTYKGNKLIVHLVFDSLINVLYQSPLDIPKVTHTTYKFRSGRTYFDQNKTDTIEIINNDFPPYNKAYTISGASLIRVNKLVGVFAITKYRKKNSQDTLRIWLSVSQDISLSKPILKRVDSISIPVK